MKSHINKEKGKNYLLHLKSISRIEWYYDNFSSLQSLKFIYDEYGIGIQFLRKMVEYLQKGIDQISLEKKTNIYDEVKTTSKIEIGQEEMLLTPSEFQQIFRELEPVRYIIYFSNLFYLFTIFF